MSTKASNTASTQWHASCQQLIKQSPSYDAHSRLCSQPFAKGKISGSKRCKLGSLVMRKGDIVDLKGLERKHRRLGSLIGSFE